MSNAIEKTISKLIKFENYRTQTYEDHNPINVVLCSPHSIKKGAFTPKDLSYLEEDFVKNYGNPLAFVDVNESKMFIEESEDKISIKIKQYSSNRKVATKYFITRRSTIFITFNYKTKMFYVGRINAKKKKVINKTLSVNPTFVRIRYMIESYCDQLKVNPEEYFMFFIRKIWDKLDLKSNGKFELKENSFLNYTLTYYLVNNIKIPNQWEKFSRTFFLKKDLKKHKFNFVDTVMSKLNLKGSKVKRLLNEVKRLNLPKMTFLFHLLGIDKFNSISDKVFDESYDVFYLSSDDVYSCIKEWDCFYPDWYFSQFIIDLTDKEKDRIVNILQIEDGLDMNILCDHLNFKKQLNLLGENVKIKFENINDFHKEHEEWSKLLQSYKTGDVERFYGKIESLSEPIEYNNEVYYPVLLTKTDDFEKESQHQHNCVRTYSEKPHCIIFSVRKGSSDGDERMTIELQYRKRQLINVQERIKYNRLPDENFSHVGKELLVKANFLYQMEVLKLPKMTKKYPNGRVIERQATFKYGDDVIGLNIHQMTPVWNKSLAENNYNYDLLPEPVERYEFFDDLLP
jgi:hypothetical protein